jgi:hypothetical protein
MLMSSISSTSAKCHGPRNGRRLDLACKPFAASGIELLGIIDAHDARPGREDDRSCGDRTGKRAHPGFIHAGHVSSPGRPQQALVLKHLAQPLALGPVLEPPPRDRSKDRTRTWATVRLEGCLSGDVEHPPLNHEPQSHPRQAMQCHGR